MFKNWNTKNRLFVCYGLRHLSKFMTSPRTESERFQRDSVEAGQSCGSSIAPRRSVEGNEQRECTEAPRLNCSIRTISMESQAPHCHVPHKEDGHCHYSEHNLCCFEIVANLQPVAMDAVSRINLQAHKGPFVICDYGAADGAISNAIFHDVIKRLKEKYGAEQLQVHVIYEDQAVNDFKSIFMQIQGMIPGPVSYLQEGGIFVSACGTSFYSQCLPDNSVYLGFSSTAFHWLSERPCHLSDTADAGNATVPDEIKLFSLQASRDWETILLHRAKELAPGGQMVISMLCKDKEGYFTGYSPSIKHGRTATMDRLWKKMLNMKKISENEFKAATHNMYYRTEDELVAPFVDVDSAVSRAGLRIVSLGMHWIECKHRKNWRNQPLKDKATARQHAVRLVSAIRSWSNYTYLSALSSSRTDQVKQELVDELYKMYEDEVAAAPEDYAHDYFHGDIHIEKLTQTQERI